MPERVLLLGGRGLLGKKIWSVLVGSGYEVFVPSRTEFDLLEVVKNSDYFDKVKPHHVINCAAKHDLVACHKDFSMAESINVTAAEHIARKCKESDAFFIHFSTDYVFDGKKRSPYTESDLAKPLNNYGITKRNGEIAVLAVNPHSCVLRVAALYGEGISKDKGSSCFAERIRQKLESGETVRVVTDQVVSPTSTGDIALQVLCLLRNRPNGLFHCVNQGNASWYELSSFIGEFLKVPQSQVVPIFSENQSSDGILRPMYSALENKRLKGQGLDLMPHWKESMLKFLDVGSKQ